VCGTGTGEVSVCPVQDYVTIRSSRHLVLKLGDEFEFWTVNLVFETAEYTQCVMEGKCCAVYRSSERCQDRQYPWLLAIMMRTSTLNVLCTISEVRIVNAVILKDRTSFQTVMVQYYRSFQPIYL
jgi:hypothetical protein